MLCMHDLSIDEENNDMTACSCSAPKEPLFHSVQTDWCYKDSGPAEPKIIYVTSPGPDPPTDVTPRIPFWEGPAPEEGTPRVSSEPSRRKGSAHTSPEGRGLRPPARGAPPRPARGVSCPGATNFAELRHLVPGSSVGNSS